MDQRAEEIGWIEQTLRGEQAPFGQLMHRYAGAVYNLAYRMLGNAEDAEDASQEIFIRAYTRLASFDRQRRFSTWLLSIGSNYCIDRLRRRRFAWMPLEDAAYALPDSAALAGRATGGCGGPDRAARGATLCGAPGNCWRRGADRAAWGGRCVGRGRALGAAVWRWWQRPQSRTIDHPIAGQTTLA